MAKRKSKEKRNWSEYNEELVVKGEFYLDLGFVNDWNDELFEMNRGKKGGRAIQISRFIHKLKKLFGSNGSIIVVSR
ncbi:MAG: hypothetical protein MOIL_01077 [Candidatus Methanolliviera sp. GoM_oil]|nr:MAG: hypothetical protein MOIL_01077 [Candidatus Methanolliviera sp. GoM_oil]